MRAVTRRDGTFHFTDTPAPARNNDDQVLVRVTAISENRGEHGFPWKSGDVVGWDALGTVVETSDDGLGPPIGSRVVTWAFSGAWAEYRITSRRTLAVVPDSVPDLTAAALPVVGMTALQAVSMAGAREGSRIAITGANGGVGHLAVQLAAASGCHITALVRDRARGEWLRELPGCEAVEVVETSDLGTPREFDAVIDSVGGPLLVRLLDDLAPFGRAVIVGAASEQPATIDTAAIGGKRIDLLGIKLPEEVDEALAHLLSLCRAGHLEIRVTDGGDWHNLVAATGPTNGRDGKHVFTVPQK